MASGVIEISPVNENQFEVAQQWVLDNIPSGVTGIQFEWTPAADTQELDQNTMRICATGPLDVLIPMRNAIVNRAQQLGLTVTVNKGTKGLAEELRPLAKAFKEGQITKEQLKQQLASVWRENRIVPREDLDQLKRVLQSHGFQNLNAFREWLND